MGIMSKTSRLPERPKPPSWAEITTDVTDASSNDVVFSLGRDYLSITSTTAVPGPNSVLEKTSNANLNAADTDSLNQDMTQINIEEVKASNANVLQLINLYSELNDSVSSLQDQQGHLKQMTEELSQSAAELKLLAQNISADMADKCDNSVGPDKNLSRGKPKQKRKK